MIHQNKENRDKLAKEYAYNKFPVSNIEVRKDFTQDVNFARRCSHHQAFQDGWDSCESVFIKEIDRCREIAERDAKEYAELKSENEELKEVIKEFSESAEAIETLCKHLKLASVIFSKKKG